MEMHSIKNQAISFYLYIEVFYSIYGILSVLSLAGVQLT